MDYSKYRIIAKTNDTWSKKNKETVYVLDFKNESLVHVMVSEGDTSPLQTLKTSRLRITAKGKKYYSLSKNRYSYYLSSKDLDGISADYSKKKYDGIDTEIKPLNDLEIAQRKQLIIDKYWNGIKSFYLKKSTIDLGLLKLPVSKGSVGSDYLRNNGWGNDAIIVRQSGFLYNLGNASEYVKDKL